MNYIITLRNQDFNFSFKWNDSIPSWLHHKAIKIIDLKKDYGLVTKNRYNVMPYHIDVKEFESLKPISMKKLEDMFKKIGMEIVYTPFKLLREK